MVNTDEVQEESRFLVRRQGAIKPSVLSLSTITGIFWVVGEKHENNKIKGRRKSALLQDAPLKLPPDWRNWLTPIAVFLLSVFYR